MFSYKLISAVVKIWMCSWKIGPLFYIIIHHHKLNNSVSNTILLEAFLSKWTVFPEQNDADLEILVTLLTLIFSKKYEFWLKLVYVPVGVLIQEIS